MPNPEHLKILKKGVDHWNQWRKENPEIKPNLSKTKLTGVDLSGAYFRWANLRSANLCSANLTHANLKETDLNRANLRAAYLRWAKLNNADLSGANLRGANLSGANLRGANLSNADLTWADLIEADLSNADLSNADLSEAKLFETHFSNVDLSQVKGLESCHHSGPSPIDQRTLIRSGKLTEVFLKGCGFPDQFIDNLPSLLNSLEAIQYHSLFISYSSKDDELAKRLYADLQAEGVRCWFALEDMKTGDKFRIRIDEVIHLHEKLLLVLSENSVASKWVEKEVETAFEKEEAWEETVLFPIQLDDSVVAMKKGWPADIRRSRHIGDFTNWKDHDSYQKAFKRLLRDLKNDSKKNEPKA